MINFIFYLFSRKEATRDYLGIMKECWMGRNVALSLTGIYSLTSHLKTTGFLDDIQAPSKGKTLNSAKQEITLALLQSSRCTHRTVQCCTCCTHRTVQQDEAPMTQVLQIWDSLIQSVQFYDSLQVTSLLWLLRKLQSNIYRNINKNNITSQMFLTNHILYIILKTTNWLVADFINAM